MATIDKSLKQLNKGWKETEAAELGTGFVKLPDGDYTMILKPASVELAKKSQRLQIVWPMVVASGKSEGKKISDFQGLDTEQGISYAKARMEMLGIDTDCTAEELPGVLDKWFKKKYGDKSVSVALKTKDEFQNIYMNGYADETGEDESDKGKDKDADKDKDKGKSDDDKPSKKEVRAMSRKELRKLLKDNNISESKVDPDDFKDDDELKDAVIDALKI